MKQEQIEKCINEAICEISDQTVFSDDQILLLTEMLYRVYQAINLAQREKT